jgi:hypothetical protein
VLPCPPTLGRTSVADLWRLRRRMLSRSTRVLLAFAAGVVLLGWWSVASSGAATLGGGGGAAGVRGGDWVAAAADAAALDARVNTHHGAATPAQALLHPADLASVLVPANARHVLMERTAFYCNQPGERGVTAADPPPAELQPPPFAVRELQLVQVHVLVRHGDRANLAGDWVEGVVTAAR